MRLSYNSSKIRIIRLVMKGLILTLLTAGLYRFWYITDIRRFLWCHSALGDDDLEYRGKGKELLKGFIWVMLFTAPFYGAFIALSIQPFEKVFWFYFILIQFFIMLFFAASYKFKQYLYSRTALRGITFSLTGSSVLFGLKAVFMINISILTCGLLWPWGWSWLEGTILRHSAFGSLKAHYRGKAYFLLKEAKILWIIIYAPILVVLIYLMSTENTPILVMVLNDIDFLKTPLVLKEYLFIYADAVIVSFIWFIICIFLFAPFIKAACFRWRLASFSLEGVTASSDLSGMMLLKTHVVFLLYILLISLCILLCWGSILLFYYKPDSMQWQAYESFENANILLSHIYENPLLGIIATVIAYICWLLLFGFIKIAFLKQKIWSLKINSVQLYDSDKLDEAQNLKKNHTALGEGFFDIIDLGSI